MRIRNIALALGVLVLAGIAPGCGKKAFEGLLGANKVPAVQITCGAVNSDRTNPLTQPFSIHFCWSAFDPDGFVDHYEYCSSPADTGLADRARWKTTKLHEVTLQFPVDSLAIPVGDSLAPRNPIFLGGAEFFIRAVDNEGGLSPWEVRYFNALTVAPTTALDFPNGEFGVVGPSMTARWHGQDLDATDPKRLPVRFHIFFKDITPRPQVIDVAGADALIRATMNEPPAPGRNFYVGGDTTSYTFKLTSGHTYLLVVKSIDEAGAEDPVPTPLVDKPGEERRQKVNYFSIGRNVAIFTSLPTAARPTLQLFAGSQGKSFSGLDLSNPLSVQVPPNVDLSFVWGATASGYGGKVANYRYALDIDDPTATSPTVTQKGGFVWTSPDERSTSAIISGFPDKGIHYFYVQVFDDAGSSSIGVVQIEVIPVTFDRPLLFVLDNTTLPLDNVNGPGLSGVEQEQFWRDVLETDRYWVDFRTNAAGECRPVAQGDSVILNLGTNRLRFGISLSTLSHYKVIVWQVPLPTPGAGFDYALRQLVTSTTISNNLYTWLQAGGCIWGSGGGFAKWLMGQKGAGAIGSYPFIPQDANVEDNNHFIVDVLGIHGPDTMFTTDGSGRAGTDFDVRMRGMDPWPVPFIRQTAFGEERRTLPAMTFDVGRVVALPTNRWNPLTTLMPYPSTNECMRDFPTQYRPAFPESSTWQPIGLYRSLGRRAQVNYVARQTSMWVDSSVCAWYKLGTTLTTGSSAKVSAPYQLYYFGFELPLMHREEVRQVADIVLSTKGWNIWRGACPPQGTQLTLERNNELNANAARIPELRRLQSGPARLSATADAAKNRRR
ncbi:MAG: hypothetical protein HZB25_02145 [Candidatus Eisenbacteria bacterium]|nr:hypothetical protein [Candidatus Eisenbacteria bacterium]